MRIYIPKSESDFIKAKNFMSDIVQNEFGYKLNKEWHKDILNLKDTYSGARTTIYIALEKGQIVGTIAARPYDREYIYFGKKYNKVNTLGIWRHYIKKEYRGMGIGSLLLSKIIKHSKEHGFKYLYLHTQKTISGSLEYWIAKGFKKTWDVLDKYKTVHLEMMVK